MSPSTTSSPKTSIGRPAKFQKQELIAARFVAAGIAGITEVVVFHPVDTVAKRLMSNQSRITSSSHLNAVIFREHAFHHFGQRFLSLFPGLTYNASYKILQRGYKYGGQPVIREYLSKHHGTSFSEKFGPRNGKAMLNATAGSLVGISEIILLPLDVLKIKRQTNPEAFRNRGFLRIVRDEGTGLYRGWAWTAARNAPGSFALFGGFTAAKQYLFGLDDLDRATQLQNLVASAAGSSASLIVSAPLDVVKTRIQSRNFGVKESGVTIISNMIRFEGLGAFFKGLIPKLLTTGPKITFSFWLAHSLAAAFSREV